MPEVETGHTTTDLVSLDAILVRIGQFGKLQIFIYFLLCIPIVLNAVLTVSYIFVASPVVHRCRVPECDTSNSTFQEPWTEFSIPKTPNGDLTNCHRYVPLNKSLGLDNNGTCLAGKFDQVAVEECGTDFVFRDNEVTIANDFKIFCSDEWKLSLVGTISNVGQFIGIPLGGYFSDRYGRRKVLAIGGFVSAAMGVAHSFTTDFYTFLLFALLDNIFGSCLYAIVFVLALEWVSPKVRVIGCSVITIVYAVGQCVLAIVAKNFPNWRTIQLIFYIPALGQIFFLWILPESIRWLLSQGEEEKATKILHKFAKANKRKVSHATTEKLLLTYRYKLADTEESKFPIKDAFSSLFWRIINCSLCWFTNVLLYYGLNLNMILFGKDKYDNFMLMSLIEIPGIMLPYLTMNRFGRRYSLFGFMIVCGICISLTVFVSSDWYYLQLSLFLLGKMSVTASFQVLYFFTSEIFPTSVRNSMLSFCSMFGRFGSMVAPQTPVIAKYHEHAPAILFAGFALISAFLAFLLPETRNTVLPSTVQEAQQIGLKKEVVENENEPKLQEPI